MASTPSGTYGQLRLEANIPFTSAVARWSDVSWALYFDELGGPNLANNASVAASVVVEQAGTAFSGPFGFDWTPGGLQGAFIASGLTRIYHDTDGIFRGGATEGVVAVIANIGATGSSGAGGPTQVIAYLATPVLKVIPGTPSSVVASRVSDISINVGWAQSSASNGQPTANTVRRKINGGAWADAVTISPTLSTSLAAAANQKLVYGVKGTNAAGDSAWSADSTPIYTTPGAPTGVTATKVGSDIVITWTPNVAFTEHQHLIEHGVDVAGVVTWDGSTLATKSAGISTHTHTAPNPAQRHVYRVWAKNTDVGALISAKPTSNVVQLVTAPNAPTLAPLPAFVDRAVAQNITWTHNPVDTTAQSAYEFSYSTNGGGLWNTTGKVTSAVAARTIAALAYAANTALSIRVRTWGAATTGGSEGTGASPWSAISLITFKSKPVASIVSPANGGTYTQAGLTVQLGFSQPESASFVSATIGLYNAAGTVLLEEIISTTLAATLFATRLADLTSYVVKATVTDSNGLVSSQVTSAFSVDYIEPVAAVVTVTYLNDSAIAQLDLMIPAAGGGLVAATSVTVDRVIDGVSERLYTDYPAAPSLSLLDTTPTINGDNLYRVTTKSVDGATTVVTATLTTTERLWAFMSKGAGYTLIIKFGGELKPKVAPSVDGSLFKASGRDRPIAQYATTGDLVVSGVGEVAEDFGSTPAEIEAFLKVPGKACYRDPSGRRMFGKVSGQISLETPTHSMFPYSVTETA